MKKSLYLLVCLLGISLIACKKDNIESSSYHYTIDELQVLSQTLDLPDVPESYKLRLPNHLGGRTINANNSLATLGRVLFYDKNLSANGKVSCASCHKAEHAFADDVAFSEGFDGKLTKRNSLGLASFPVSMPTMAPPAQDSSGTKGPTAFLNKVS